MADYRPLVDAYLASGGTVTVCPPRTYALDAAAYGNWRQQSEANFKAMKRRQAEGFGRIVEQVRALAAKGQTGPEIRKALGISPYQLQRACRRGSIRIRRQHVSRDSAILALVRQGLSNAEIAEARGCTVKTVHNAKSRLRQRGLLDA